MLENVDELYMRKILEVPAKTPIAGLYITLGLIPIRFLLKKKRVMFLHYLLNSDSNSLVSKVLMAQVDQPAKDDWCNVVEEDMDQLGMKGMSIEDFQETSKEAMKTMVKEVKTMKI